MTTKHTICLFGATLDVGNMGCRALSVSLIKLFYQRFGNPNIFLLYGAKKSGKRIININNKNICINVLNCRLSPKSKFSEHILIILLMALVYRILPINYIRYNILKTIPWIQVLLTADIVGDIRGGDSFSDIYGKNRIFWGSIPCIIAILLKKKIILLPQTYGPYKSIFSRFIARFIFKKADKIFSRDLEGISLVKKMLRKEKNQEKIKFCPDVAFCLDAVKPKEIAIHPVLPNRENIIIGINISGLLYYGGYTQKNMFMLKDDYNTVISDIINYFLQNTSSHIILIPHVFGSGIESDFEVCKKVKEGIGSDYQERVHTVVNWNDQNEIKWIIGLCDYFIGSRMHACIAALSQNIPTIGFAYSKKFNGVFESLDLSDMVLDARELNKEEVVEKIRILNNQSQKIKNTLEKKIPIIKNQIINIFYNDL